MLYFDEDDLELIFNLIVKHYSDREDVPNYLNEQEGIKNLLGVFERVHMDFYPSLIDKAVCLFVQINKGHFFSNGNKRLALVTAIGFLNINDKKVANLSREKFKEILLSLFPKCEDTLEDQKDFSPEEYALYNLSVIVADSYRHISEKEGFEVLKQKVANFFNEVITDY